ncbi:unnamed protein product [Urochloa decumbens]|uniref:Nucleotide-diphospho-sugar transferase domain-containing protein n=1 Tax=Urochloa decumbens TaxID=240449 RepID=A0ABC9H4S0_9POAL
MSTVTNLLRFLLVASIGTVGYVVLLQQRYSPFPCSHVIDVPPATTSRNNKATRSTDNPATDAASAAAGGDDNLPELLSRAAMEDNTIIMTFTNKAWSAPGSLTDLFLESFRTGIRTAPLLNHLVIVAVDAATFSRCQQTHPLCYALPVTTNNQSASTTAANYASEQRFVFTDVDIVWLRNPLLRIPVAADMAFSCDWYHGSNPYDLDKRANGGFLYVKGSARTAASYAGWWNASRAAYPGQHEQCVFEQVKRELGERHGVTVQKDWHKLCTFHANCVIGLEGKLEMLRGVLDEWQRFKAKAGPNGTVLTD